MSSQWGWVLISSILGLLFVTVCFGKGPASEEDPRVVWLMRNAIALRSIDPNDEDFADLKPLAKILGGVRIVQLGEQSHGDGATFHAKTRLLKFLHQKLGFDLLAFESGLYDCHKASELLRGGMDPYEAFRHGVFSRAWAQSEQIGPLIEYWGRVAKSQRPLELCGFDCQFSAKASRGESLVKDVNALWDRLGAARPNPCLCATIVKTLTEMADYSSTWDKPSPQERQQWHNALAAWGKALEVARPSDTLPEAELVFWRQFVTSTSTLAAICGYGETEDSFKSWNLRDSQMARNLVWLARTVYPKRKIIVWAASSHLSREPLRRWADSKRGLKMPMGHHVWKIMGEQTYTVGFTAAEGEYKYSYEDKPRQLPPPAPGSLEDLFVRAGCTYAFVDFRSLGPDGAWLTQKLIARPFGHGRMEANWTDIFDGIVFIKRMFGSTKRRTD